MGWIANLSDGRTIFQNDVEGEKSSWLQLLDLVESDGVRVTQLRLQVAGRTYHAIPRSTAYFQATTVSGVVGREGVTKVRQGVGSVVGDSVFILWVDKQGECWTEVRPYT